MTPKYVNVYISDKYVRTRNTRAEMYAGRVVCCSLVSHVECAPRALLMLEKKTGETDGLTHAYRQTQPA